MANYSIEPIAAVLGLDSGEALIATRKTIAAQAGVVRVKPFTASLRVSSGRITAAVAQLRLGSGYTTMRINETAEFPSPTPVEPPGGGATEYPTLKPTSREFVAAKYADSVIHTMNGRSSRFLMTSKPGQATLTLRYENVHDSLGKDFIDFYEYCNGSIKQIILPPDFLAGLGDDLKPYIDLYGSTMTWRWDSPPSIDFVKKGIINITVNLRAYTSPGVIGTAPGVDGGSYQPQDYIDNTRYESFGGMSITPPPPIEPGDGKKWIAYSITQASSASGNYHSQPVYGNNGFVFMARLLDGDIVEIYKFNSSGSNIWKLSASASAASITIYPANYSTDSIALYGIANNLFVLAFRASPSYLCVVAFNSNGEILYQQRYVNIPYVNLTYSSATGYMTGCYQSNTGAIVIVQIDPSDGSVVKIASISSPNRPGFQRPNNVIPRPDGSLVLVTQRTLTEIDPTLSTINTLRGFDGIDMGFIGAAAGGSFYMRIDNYKICEFDLSLQPTRILYVNIFDPSIEFDSGSNFFVYFGDSSNYLYNVNLDSLSVNWFLFSSRGEYTQQSLLTRDRFTLDRVNRRLLTTPANSIYSSIPGTTSYSCVISNKFRLSVDTQMLHTPVPPDFYVNSFTTYPPYNVGSPHYNFIQNSSQTIYTSQFTSTISDYGGSPIVETTLDFQFTGSVYTVLSED